MKFILGTKKEMTQIFNDEDGSVVPVTVVKAGSCQVIRIKKKDEKDGYSAVQVGLAGKKKLGKREKGQLKDLGNLQYIKEFRVDEMGDLKRGDWISVDSFEVGDKVRVIGTSKGKGFQGVVRRHGFHGQKASHGNKDQERAPGSIGPTEPARVFPGMRMPGHMGSDQVTVKNLKIAKVDTENNEIYIKGAIPGSRGSLIMISGEGEVKIKKSTDQENKKSINQESKKLEDQERRVVDSGLSETEKKDENKKEEKKEELKKSEEIDNKDKQDKESKKEETK